MQLSPEALRQKLEQNAVLARVLIDVARELPTVVSMGQRPQSEGPDNSTRDREHPTIL
jgi:hypothetical protein